MIFTNLSKRGTLFSIGLVQYHVSNSSPQVLLVLTITDQNMQHLFRCSNTFMGALSHFVHTSQLPMIQVASERDIDKNREGEVFCLMMMMLDKVFVALIEVEHSTDQLCNDTGTKIQVSDLLGF